MTAGRRLGLFAATLAVVVAGAFGAGRVLDVGAADGHGHGDAAGSAGHGAAADGHGGDGVHGGDAALSPAPVAEAGLRLVVEDPERRAGRAALLRLRIEDAAGRAVRDFDVEHERAMHLIVVRRDLTGYQHLHPRMAADGTWSVPLTLGDPGVYRLFADFATAGRSHTLGTDLTVPGDHRPAGLAAGPVVAAGPYAVRVDGVPSAGRPGTLRFTVTRDGRPVEDLEPYLGALGHLVVLREGDLAFLHVHPEDAARPGEIAFAATVPAPGRHVAYLQFRHAAEVRTAAFVLEVRP